MVLKRKRFFRFWRLFPGLLFLLMLCACSGGNSNSGTGTVSFNLDWKSATTADTNIQLAAADNVCDDYQISTINATIYDAANASIATKSFNCSDGSGSFNAIPAGSGYKLVIMGMVSGNADWRGQKNDLSVADGKTTNAGKITMTYQGSDTTSPEVTKVSPNASIVDAALNTTIKALFNEAMNGSTITMSSFTLVKSSDNSSVAGQVSYDNTSMTATFTPDANLEANTKYIATLTIGIQDIAGNSLAGGNVTDGSYQWTFTTGTTTTECTYAISPSKTEITLPSDASSRTVSVIASPSDGSCAWTATTSELWILITSGASGTGNGDVTYKVDENKTGSNRIGTISVADKTLNITQLAAGSLPPLIWGAGNWDEVVWQ